ncbi:MAG: hypothetical protein V3T15_10575 [Pseudomonadales bacterium]
MIRTMLVAAALACAAGMNVKALAGEGALFDSHDPLALVLEAPWRRIMRKRTDDPAHEGELRYEGPDASHALSVDVGLRGHSRLEFCRFPPISLNFKRKQATGTVFDGQNKLKLVTQCASGSRYRDHLRLEYIVYRALNLLTPQSFRVRWVEIRYIDSEGKRRDKAEPGFFIEDEARMAKRLGLERISAKRLDPRHVDEHYLGLIALFQFMIGNTDWSIVTGLRGEDCCHNGKLLGSSGVESDLIVVPYDFDQAGLIDVDYAIPYEKLGITDVKQRLYRGFCRTSARLDEIIDQFEAERSAILGLLDAVELSASSKRKAVRYLEGFFDIIGEPEDVERRIERKCRGT